MQNQSFSPQAAPEPLISFVIAAYNLPAPLLTDCIGSITSLSLLRGEREIIVIDDGSDTPLLPLLDSISADILYIRQENQGLSAARNMGIQCAHGRYIQFVDGDDMLNTEIYEHIVTLLRRQCADVVMFRLSRQAEHCGTGHFDGPLEGHEYMRHYNLRPSACGYVFLKSLLLDLRFSIGLLHEDEAFTPQLILRAERLFFTDDHAYYYRDRIGSIMNYDDPEWVSRRLSDMRTVLFHLHDMLDTLPQAEREGLHRRVSQFTMDYLYQVVRLTHSSSVLEQHVVLLRKKGLFPLPNRRYTRKYVWFRRLSNSRAGRLLLCKALK